MTIYRFREHIRRAACEPHHSLRAAELVVYALIGGMIVILTVASGVFS